jgi:hypothetical protein
MNINLLTDLTRLARLGANALGQSAGPETMKQVWTVIGEAEKIAEDERQKALYASENAVKTDDASAS